MKTHNVFPGDQKDREAIRIALKAAETVLDPDWYGDLLLASEWINVAPGSFERKYRAENCFNPFEGPQIDFEGPVIWAVERVIEFVFVQIRFKVVLYGLEFEGSSEYRWQEADLVVLKYEEGSPEDVFKLEAANGHLPSLVTWNVVEPEPLR